MFIGHFAVGLAAKKASPKLNLGLLFIACQLLDLIWPVLVLIGVEIVSVDSTATVVTPLNFSYYPYSHSLLMTILYSLILGFVIWNIKKSLKTGLVLVSVVTSHWVLDLLTHRPDLPLYFDNFKVGLGLWNSVVGTFIVEVVMFIIGISFYLKASPLITNKRKVIFWSMIGFLSIIYLGNIFGPKIPDGTHPNVIAGPALATWLIVLWGYYADKVTRSPSSSPVC
jgi:membrane-bound metal-dependent hydrolase YbcI (DUF457 family)